MFTRPVAALGAVMSALVVTLCLSGIPSSPEAAAAKGSELRSSTGATPTPTPPPGTRHRRGPVQRDLSVRPLVAGGSRPNVLVLMTDDARYDDLRFMPNVRRLIGRQGVRFENAFSPQPLCCPARASFMTGEYTHNHGVWSHVPPFGFQAFRDHQTIATWLHDAGYDTEFSGKYLNGYGKQHARNGEPSTRYVPPGWTDWQGATDGAAQVDAALRGGVYHYFDTTLNHNGRLVPHQGEYQTYVLGRLARRNIERAPASPRPFFSWVSFAAPHYGGPQEPDDPPPLRRSDGSVQVFQNPARPDAVKGRFDSSIRRILGARGEADVSDKPFFIRDLPPLSRGERRSVLEDARQRAEALSVVDRQVGRIIHTLRTTRQLRNTYVIFTSDNGYFLGEHRMRQGKILPYEPSLRVPLVIRGPGIPHGQVRTDPFTMIDFAPTILDAAGVQVPRSVDGVSLLDVARHGDRGWDRGILTETGPRAVGTDTAESDNFLVAKHGPSPLRFSQGVRTGDYLYVEHASRERELYDLRSDPREVHNLVDRPDMREVVQQLAHQLDVLRDCKGAGCAVPLPASLRTRHPEVPARDGTPD